MKHSKKKIFIGNMFFVFVVSVCIGAILKKTINQHVYTGYNDPMLRVEQGEFYDIDQAEQNFYAQIVSEK